MTRYVMHDTYGSNNLRCAGMEKRPKIRAVTRGDARQRFDAWPCYVCMPFTRSGPIVVVEKREP